MNTRDLSLSAVAALLRSRTEEAGRGETSFVAGDPGPARPPFSITISREVGALGNSVAAEVGRRLGWPVYDREILNETAEQLHQPHSHVHAVDERPISWLTETVSDLFGAPRISVDAYIKHLVTAVRGLGALGRYVIVGPGPDPGPIIG